MGKSTRKKQLAERINSLRKQYDAFLEEDKKRKERNDYILGKLDNMRAATVALRIRYNTLKPIESQSKDDSVPNNCLQVTPLRNNTLLQLNDETDKNEILKEINKRFILIPRNSSLLTQNLTHSKEKIDDIDWTSKYNILDQLKQSELEFDVTKENELTKTIKENKICNKKISFEDSTDDEKDIDTSLSENICERENYENKDLNVLKNSLGHGIISDDNIKNVLTNTSQMSNNDGIDGNTASNATNYDNSRLQHTFDKIDKLQVEENNHETQNLIQTEANLLADDIIKSLPENNTEKFDPGIQNGQHLLENEFIDIHHKSDAPVLKHNAYDIQPQDSHIKDTQVDYYTQQPGIIQDTSNGHSEIQDMNYEKQTEEETRAGTQNTDYEKHNIVADTNYYNEQNVNHPDEYQNFEEENIVTSNTHYDEKTAQQAELYPTEQLNQNNVTENNYYDQNNEQSKQYEHHLVEEPNQSYGDNIVFENNQEPADQYEQLGEQQNTNYDEQQIVAENNYYDENNQKQVEQYEQLNEQQISNYSEQPIVADNNYYDENNQQQANLHQQYSAEQLTANYDEQNIVSENVYYDENGQQQANQYDPLAEQHISNYGEQPVAVENNQQYATEQSNDNYNEQYDENYQQQFNNDQGPYEEIHQNEETVILSNEQLTQG